MKLDRVREFAFESVQPTSGFPDQIEEQADDDRHHGGDDENDDDEFGPTRIFDSCCLYICSVVEMSEWCLENKEKQNSKNFREQEF